MGSDQHCCCGRLSGISLPTRYTETKEVETRVLGHTWELNSRPLAQKAVHLPTVLILAPKKYLQLF